MSTSVLLCGILGISLSPGVIHMIASCLLLNSLLQGPAERLSLSDKHVTETKQILASQLDAELPNLPFANWFGQTVGREAGVIWQLSECGKQLDDQPNSNDDMQACTEANAILPDGRKVVVMILIGTFKKGMIRTPEFYSGIIEQRGELYMFRQLSDLPRLLQLPKSMAAGVRLPVVAIPKGMMEDKYKITVGLPGWIGKRPDRHLMVEEVPPPLSPQVMPQQSNTTSAADNLSVSVEPGLNIASGSPKQSGAVLWGEIVTRVQPHYPANAKRVMAAGLVEVRITISKEGRVIGAKAISGHPLLHDAAVEAARQWVFKPATLNGVTVETMMALTFEFKVPQ
jgi:TonB family protein